MTLNYTTDRTGFILWHCWAD